MKKSRVKKVSLGFIFALILGTVPISSQAGSKGPSLDSEPSYCDPNVFDEKEVFLGDGLKLEESGINRAHAFRLGKVTLVGVGVGNSKASSLIDLAKRFSSAAPGAPSSKERNYCTWYLNHPKTPQDTRRIEAAKTFNQRDIPKSPVVLNEEEAAKEFIEILKGSFDEESNNFVSCVTEQNYIAMGCNEMMHRGPTVFGMLLAFSGCSPEHALEIANQTWGLNGVHRKVRLAVIKKAYELGELHKESRRKLVEAFSAK